MLPPPHCGPRGASPQARSLSTPLRGLLSSRVLPGCRAPSPSSAGLCLCRNILRLINAFELPDQSVNRDDYAAVLSHLNATQPDTVARLCLETCRLEDFLDKVPEGPQTFSTGLAQTGLRAVDKGHWADPVPRPGLASRAPVASDAVCLAGAAGWGGPSEGGFSGQLTGT